MNNKIGSILVMLAAFAAVAAGQVQEPIKSVRKGTVTGTIRWSKTYGIIPMVREILRQHRVHSNTGFSRDLSILADRPSEALRNCLTVITSRLTLGRCNVFSTPSKNWE